MLLDDGHPCLKLLLHLHRNRAIKRRLLGSREDVDELCGKDNRISEQSTEEEEERVNGKGKKRAEKGVRRLPSGVRLGKLLHQDWDENRVECRAVPHYQLDEPPLLPEREVHVGDKLVPRADTRGDEVGNAREHVVAFNVLLFGKRLQQMEQIYLYNRATLKL